jgi:shikimate kinase
MHFMDAYLAHATQQIRAARRDLAADNRRYEQCLLAQLAEVDAMLKRLAQVCSWGGGIGADNLAQRMVDNHEYTIWLARKMELERDLMEYWGMK